MNAFQVLRISIATVLAMVAIIIIKFSALILAVSIVISGVKE